jgi:hypothetical protein
MPYRIEWEPKGAIKHFWGKVSFDDVYQSESEIQSSPKFDNLRFVMSVFEGDAGITLSNTESDLILALRLGAMHTNPRLKYAYVSGNDTARIRVEETVKKSNSAFPVMMFGNIDDAMEWIRT